MLALVLIASCSGKYDHVTSVIKDEILSSCVVDKMKSIKSTELNKITKIVCQNGVNDLTGISKLTNLEKLFLQGHKLVDLNTLGNIPTLKIISVAGSKTLHSLEGIEAASNLEEVQANKTPLLKNISSIANLKNLKIFSAMMAKIDDISSLGGAKYLSKVTISYNSISSLNPLGNKKKLKWLTAYNNPITSLKNIRNNTNMVVFGIDKRLSDLCGEVDFLRKNLAKEAKVYGPVGCN